MELARLTTVEVDQLDRDIPVVIPVAAVEQHGPHLPVFTDSMLLGEVVRRAHEDLEDSILVWPLMWLGSSHHHIDFPGTVSAEPRLWIDLVGGLIDNAIAHGFRRIAVINGHGGNEVPGRQACFELRQRHRERNDLLLLMAGYWSMADPGKSIPGLHQQEIAHACEWETSMMLRVAPERVKEYRDVPAVASGSAFEPASRAWTTPDRSPQGHIGYPAKADAEKGEALLAAFGDGLKRWLQRVIDWDGKSWEG